MARVSPALQSPYLVSGGASSSVCCLQQQSCLFNRPCVSHFNNTEISCKEVLNGPKMIRLSTEE